METLQAIYFGQKHKDFNYEDMQLIKRVKRLARKHHRQAENSCNGYGVVKGERYYGGIIDDYARREYGYTVKSAYLDDEMMKEGTTVFDKEMERIELKISILLANPKMLKFTVEYQGDPRGNTVKLYYEGDFVEL